MIRMMLAVVLLLAQGRPDEPQAVSAALDQALRSIPRYDANTEAKVIGDDAFLKRIFKDLLGGAPSAAEAKAFVDDPDPAKRSKKIDQLVDDDRFADFWSRRFSDVFFGDPEKLHLAQLLDNPPGTPLLAVKSFERWLRDKLKKDVPWTEIVFQMLDSRGTLEGDPAVGYLLSFNRGNGLTSEFAEGAARHFLGIRLHCARCHDHPYDVWGSNHYYGLGAFIVRQKVRAVDGVLQVKYADSGELSMDGVNLAKGGQFAPKFVYGGTTEKNDDRMKVLATYMTARSTTQLPRALANRVWGWLLGYGIVHPVDDFNPMNRAAVPALMETLVRDAIDHKYSLKRMVRVICKTNAYQMQTQEEAPDAESFRHLQSKRVAQGRYTPFGKPAPLPLAFEVPAAWARMRGMSGAKALYLAPGKADPLRRAELTLFAGKKDKQFLEVGAKQFIKPKTATQVLAGKLKGTLGEISGLNTCIRDADGPTDHVTLAAVMEAADGPYTFRFEGPATVINEWREEFIALLHSVASK